MSAIDVTSCRRESSLSSQPTQSWVRKTSSSLNPQENVKMNYNLHQLFPTPARVLVICGFKVRDWRGSREARIQVQTGRKKSIRFAKRSSVLYKTCWKEEAVLSFCKSWASPWQLGIWKVTLRSETKKVFRCLIEPGRHSDRARFTPRCCHGWLAQLIPNFLDICITDHLWNKIGRQPSIQAGLAWCGNSRLLTHSRSAKWGRGLEEAVHHSSINTFLAGESKFEDLKRSQRRGREEKWEMTVISKSFRVRLLHEALRSPSKTAGEPTLFNLYILAFPASPRLTLCSTKPDLYCRWRGKSMNPTQAKEVASTIRSKGKKALVWLSPMKVGWLSVGSRKY